MADRTEGTRATDNQPNPTAAGQMPKPRSEMPTIMICGAGKRLPKAATLQK